MLINCPECGKEISDVANNCPNCGFPLREPKPVNVSYQPMPPSPEELIRKKKEKKNKNSTTIACIVLFFIIMFVGSVTKSTIDDTMSNTSTVNQELSEEASQILFEEYAPQCQEYNYKDVLRNPSDYVGKKIKIEVQISSVHEESMFNAGKYYFVNDKEEQDSDYYFGNMYGVFDNRYNTSPKLLEGDVIMVYGEIVEPEYTKSFILSSDELFCIDMKFVELISE